MNMESQKIKKMFDKLIASDLIYFPKIRQKIEAPKEDGVYIIYDRFDEVVHVGRNKEKKDGLNGRLRDHLCGRSSFSKSYLSSDGYKLRKGYTFKFLVVSNKRERALLEAFAIGTLCLKHLGVN